MNTYKIYYYHKWYNFLGSESVSAVFVNALYSYAYLVAFQVNDLLARYS